MIGGGVREGGAGGGRREGGYGNGGRGCARLGKSESLQVLLDNDRHHEYRGVESWLSNLREPYPSEVDCEKGVLRPIGMERNCKRRRKFD